MLKRIVGVLLMILLVAMVYDLFTTASEALSSTSSLSLVPTLTPPAEADSGSVGVDGSGLPYVNFNFFDPSGTGRDYITQGYGRTADSYLYIHGWHNGVDIAASYGAPIYSPDNGIVFATGNQDNYCPGRAFGKFVVIEDLSRNVFLLYAHLGNILVAPNATIKEGERFATIGSSGLETGSHLHFSVFQANGFSVKSAYGCGPYPLGEDVNPIPYIESFSGS